MRKTLWGMALSLLKANRLLISFSIISILVSTVLVTTMLTYSLNAERAMEQSFRERFGEADIMVSYAPDHPGVLTREKADRIVSLPGVEASAPVLNRFLHIGEMDAPVWTIGTTANDLTRSTYKFTSDIAPSAVMLNEELARFLKVEIGDELDVEGMTLRVSEMIADLQGNISIAIIHYDRMAPFAEEGEYASGLLLKLAKDAEALPVVRMIREIDGDLRIDLVEQNELVQSNLRALNSYIIVLSFLVLVVTALLVLSNLEILLYKLRHQIAILRSIGAATGQIGRIMLIQSFVINLAGTVLGAGASVLAMNGLHGAAERVFHMPAAAGHGADWPVALVTAAACFLLYQLFMLIPAWRSTRILPLKIAEENERLDFRHKKRHRLRGLGTALTGIVMYMFGYVNGNYAVLFPGLIILLIGSLLLMPHAVERAIQGTVKGIGLRLGRLVYLTLRHMLPQVKRNAFAVISIALTVAIAVFGTTLLSTLDANNHRFLKERFEKPIMLHNRLGGQSAIDAHSLRETLLGFASIRDVEMEGASLLNYLLLNGEEIRIAPKAVYSPLVEGLKDDELVISGEMAARYHLQAGDEIMIGYPDEALQDVLPAGVYRIAGVSGDLPFDEVLMTWSNPLNVHPAVISVSIDPNDEKQALADLASVRETYPELQIRTLSEEWERAREGFVQRWGIFIIVLSVIIGCTMAGALSGLLNQILSKRKEFAILRTVGVTPSGVAWNILVQACLYLGLGIVFGGLLGLLVLVLVVALDPTPITFAWPTVGLVAAGMLLLTVATFAIAGRRISSGPILREMAMDGK